jgi:hypothetical protein
MASSIKIFTLSIFFLSAPIHTMQKIDTLSKVQLSRLCAINIANADWKISEVESLAWVIKSMEKNNNDHSHFNESWYKLRQCLKTINFYGKL